MTKQNKKLIVAIPAPWGATIPPLQHSAYGAAVLDNQFEPLARRGKDGLIEPLGASSWEVSSDHRTFRFHIDRRRHFSDGSALAAQDFKRSWEEGLRMEAKSQNKSIADALYNVKGFPDFSKKGQIEGIRVRGDDLLEIEFIKPVRVAVEYLAGLRYAAFKTVSGLPIGTGPYSMVEEKGELVLRPNPHYSGEERLFDEVRIKVTAPEDVAETLASGLIDAALFAEKSHLPGCGNGASGRIRCAYGQEGEHVAIYVNGLPGRTLSDARNRRALQALVSLKLGRLGLPLELKSSRFKQDPQSFLRFQAGRLPNDDAEELISIGKTDIARLAQAAKRRPLLVASARDCGWLLAFLRAEGIPLAKGSGRIQTPRFLEMIYKTHEADLLLGAFSVYDADPDGLYHLLGKNGAIYSPMMDRPGIGSLFDAGREIMDRALLAPHYEKVARTILTQVPYIHLGYNAVGVAYDSEKVRLSEGFTNRNNHRVTLFEPK